MDIIKQAERLYSSDYSGVEQLAQETGIGINILKHIEKGLEIYVDAQYQRDAKKVAKEIEQESSGLVDYQTMLAVIFNFMKKACEVYKDCQKSETGSRRAFAGKHGMHWTYFESFYWRHELGVGRGNLERLPDLKKMIANLEKELFMKPLAKWLDSKDDISLEEIAEHHNVEPDEFRRLVSEMYTKCTRAAIAYHSDKTDELSHGSAAQEQGVELWIYLHFKMKFRVHHDGGEEGLKHADSLKENKLYDDNL